MGSDYYYVTWMFWPPLSLYTSWKWCWYQNAVCWLRLPHERDCSATVRQKSTVTSADKVGLQKINESSILGWEQQFRQTKEVKHTNTHNITACSPKIHPRSICCRTLQSSFFSRVETPVLFLHTPTFYIINTLSIDFFLELKSCKCSLIIEQFCVSLCWRLQM